MYVSVCLHISSSPFILHAGSNFILVVNVMNKL